MYENISSNAPMSSRESRIRRSRESSAATTSPDAPRPSDIVRRSTSITPEDGPAAFASDGRPKQPDEPSPSYVRERASSIRSRGGNKKPTDKFAGRQVFQPSVVCVCETDNRGHAEPMNGTNTPVLPSVSPSPSPRKVGYNGGPSSVTVVRGSTPQSPVRGSNVQRQRKPQSSSSNNNGRVSTPNNNDGGIFYLTLPQILYSDNRLDVCFRSK